MWYLIDSVISAGAYLLEKGLFHGDMMPCNIFITDDGLVKIADNGLYSKMKSAINRYLILGDKCYLPPEVLAVIRNQDKSKLKLDHKGDIFTFAMTVLYAGTLKDSSDLYDYLGKEISESNVINRLGEFERRYSPLLMAQLNKMLQMSQEKRVDFKSMHSFLLPYKKLIRSSSGFDGKSLEVRKLRLHISPFIYQN